MVPRNVLGDHEMFWVDWEISRGLSREAKGMAQAGKGMSWMAESLNVQDTNQRLSLANWGLSRNVQGTDK